jgi:hypothetical protein
MIMWFHVQGQTAQDILNPLNAELNPICHLLALLGAHHIVHVGRIRVNLLLAPKDAETMILRHIRCYWPVTQCNIPEDLNLQ